jgi:hypothetical protein
MKITVTRILILASFLVILTPALSSQKAEKHKNSSCEPGQACDWLAAEAERIEAESAHDKYPTFSLTLTPGTRHETISEYHLGDKMWITITQTNLTKHDIYCSESSQDYEAVDEDGKPVERYPAGTEPGVIGCGIGAGGSVPDEILIDQVFKFKQPGKYTIRVSRREVFVKDENGNPPVVWSNYLTITVLAAEPASDEAK